MPHLRRLAVAAAATLTLVLVPSAAQARSFPLVGWWPMNEGRGQVVHDWSGHGNSGQLGSTAAADDNDPTWIRGVLLGSALRFDGNDFVTIPDSPDLETAQVTVAAWVRATGSPGTGRYIVAHGAYRCDRASYGLYTSSNGGLAFYVSGATHWYRSPEADPGLWDGRWHLAAGTYDGTTVRLFVDGQQVGTGTPVTTTIDYADPTGGAMFGDYSGAEVNGTPCDLYFSGDVDGVQIWSQALPVADIWKSLRSLFTLSR